MYKKVVMILFLVINLFAISNDYKIFKNQNYSIVYTKEYANEAKFIKKNIDEFLKVNDKSFGYSFDNPLKIVLVSNKNQIANAFSTQTPFNMGVYWNGGSSMNDYFSNNSWLITLFIHEMIHNYQINAKKSKISQTLQKFLGNNAEPVWAGVPFFTLPNYLIPTALIEGNAVFNESIYNNGGRLHSGSLNAMKNTLIFANKINPSTFINDHLDFPYTREKYIVGGFFMKYLSSIHGINKVNQYFYEQSIHSMNPFLLAGTFKKQFGVSFEQAVNNFVSYSKKKYKNYQENKIENQIALSKTQINLSKIDNKIYFISSDMATYKNLFIYDINKNQHTIEKTTLQNEKIFKVKSKLYTSSSGYISKDLFKYGLFDENNYVLDSTVGKSIHDTYKDKTSYIKIKDSFLFSKLYVNDKFYSNVSSSSLFDENGNIYYFKQENEKRLLYKNKELVYTFDGYFSKLCEIKNDEVYFIANTKNGSTLYKLADDILYKIISGDNIVDSKIINENQALVVSITKDGYVASKANISNQKVKDIYYEKGLANSVKLKFDTNVEDIKIEDKNYNELKQLEFSSLHPSVSYDSENGLSYSITSNFIDSLMFNQVNLYAYRENNDSITGAAYLNTRYIPFLVNVYDVNKQEKSINERGYGLSLKVFDNLLVKGRHIISAGLKYYLDYDNKDKKPLILNINHSYSEYMPLGSYSYFSSKLNLLGKHDQGSQTYGFEYNLNKHLFDELSVNAQAKAMYNNSNGNNIEIVDSYIETLQDETNVFIESLENDFLIKDIQKLSLGLNKTIHFSKYFSKFPFSLRREELFIKYNYFKINTNSSNTIKESIVGVNFNVLFGHQIPIPITIKHINSSSINTSSKMTIGFGVKY